MNLEDSNTHKTIKAYLDNEMDATERKNFEKELLINTELAETVSVLQKMNTVYNDNDWDFYNNEISELEEVNKLFTNKEITHFSKQVKQAETNYKKNTPKKLNYFIKRTASIAAASLILFSGYYFFIKKTSNTTLYNDYYNIKDLPSFTTKSETANTLSQAENLFKSQEYSKALKLFKDIEKKQYSTINPNLTLYIAICYLELEEYQLAHNKLNDLLKSNTIDHHKAYWFKALVYLKQDNKEQAIKSLENLIKNEKHFNYEKAQELLKSLK